MFSCALDLTLTPLSEAALKSPSTSSYSEPLMYFGLMWVKKLAFVGMLERHLNRPAN